MRVGKRASGHLLLPSAALQELLNALILRNPIMLTSFAYAAVRGLHKALLTFQLAKALIINDHS